MEDYVNASRSRRDLKTSSHLKLRGTPTQPSNGLPSDGILTLTPPPQYSPPLTPPSLASTKDSPPHLHPLSLGHLLRGQEKEGGEEEVGGEGRAVFSWDCGG